MASMNNHTPFIYMEVITYSRPNTDTGLNDIC